MTMKLSSSGSRLASPTTAIALGLLVLALAIALVPLAVLLHKSAGEIVLKPAVIVVLIPLSVLVAARQPRNPIGWVLLGVALSFGFFFVATLYSLLDHRSYRGTLPLSAVALVLQASWAPAIVLVAIVLWLFPDGKVPGGRARWGFLLGIALGVGFVLAVFVGNAAGAAEHLPVDSSGTLALPVNGWWALLNVIENVCFFALLGSWAIWLIVQVPKYRRATGERRLQLKWLYSGAAIFVISLIVETLVPASPSRTWQVASEVAALGLVALPLSLGIAILRFRLYEIDRVISRTLSYALVTGLVVGAYVGIITLMTKVLDFSSAVGVAASTLVAVALFNPLRKRVQHLVDRRFNRARYDAAAIVAGFTTRLREGVALDTVESDLVNVVRDAFEPTYVGVWIRDRKAVP